MRRRRLQELLVLLARILSVIFLVLAFAQPFIPALQRAAQGNEVRVFVDTSPSMLAAGETQRPLVQEAVGQAQFLGRNYGVATHFRLTGQAGGVLTQVAYTSKLAELHNSARPANWDGAAAKQELQAKASSPLYVFSDFQRHAQSQMVLKAIAKEQEVVLVPQVARPVANIYVDSVWLDDGFVRPRANIGLRMRLRNGGAEASTNCPVKVRLGGRQAAAFSVALGPGQTTTVVTQVQVLDNQLVLGQVVTEDSPVVFDNTFYFTLQPATVINVLEIGAQPVAKQAYSAEPLFAYAFASPQRINYAELRRANIVLVRELTTIDAGLREALTAVVQRGGSVVVIPTAEAAGRGATSQLLQALGVGGTQWEPVAAGPPVRQEVAMPSARDPFFRDVFGAQPRQVVMPQVAPVLRLGRSGTNILRLRDGDSYLAEFGTAGRGRTYVFTAPFDAKYGDFVAQGLFVPVLYRLAMLSYRTSQRPAYRLAEPVVALELPLTDPAKQADNTFRLVRDSLTVIPAQRLRGTSLQLTMPASMSQPGFYELRRSGQRITTLAFNTSRSESELAAYSAAELRQLIGPDQVNVRVLDGVAGPEALAHYRGEQTGQPLWRYCLLALLACLLAEGVLLRFGRPKVASRAAVAA